jgi:EAL and modified HD-GYP domain-containing signal transduction protein
MNMESAIYDHFFVARQPIFHEKGQIWGYELLFRSGPGYEVASITDGDLATFSVATSGFIRSQEDIDQSKKICVNFTEKLLLDGAPHGLPSTVTVIEILEDVIPSSELIEKLIGYKQEGYLIAIDDFEAKADLKDFIELADIIKVDVLDKRIEEVEHICDAISGSKAIRIAEKVEDSQLIPALKKLGFTLFQGYYFAKPELLAGRKIGTTETSKLRILQIIEDASMTAETIEKAITTDPSITYRLLRFLNSAAFGFSIKINSIRHAITLLGLKRLKNWLRMVVLSDLLGDKNPEIYAMALIRAKMLEEMVNEDQIKDASADSMFLFGLLSLIDSMMDIPMDQLLDRLPLPDKIKNGYIDTSSSYNKYLAFIEALEHSKPNVFEKLCRDLDFTPKQAAAAYLRSIVWTNEMNKQILE